MRYAVEPWRRSLETEARGAPRAAGMVVLAAGKLTALDAPGGGEVQMASTLAALAARGVEARPWRPWEDRLGQADVVHLFGSLPEHEATAAAARRQRVPVVLSTIAWFDWRSYWRQPRPAARRLAAVGGYAARTVYPRLPCWRRRLYHAVDLLLPNSTAEAGQLRRLFGVESERIHVVPNGADPRFALADAEPFARLVGGTGFVLSMGRIEPRKNQLGLLRALEGSGARVVVVGNAVPGHERYYRACRRAAGANVRFVGRLGHDDPRLASAYAACGCLVLAGWYETPGLVALEAAMQGVPLVLPQGGCGREYFGGDAEYVRPGDRRGIRRAVLAALGRKRNGQLARRVQRHFTWQAAAEATCQAYEKVL